MSAVLTSTLTEDRALSLLGSGVNPEQVASALGVSASRISQLLANKEFADQVASLRYDNLQKHNSRDDSYDSLEDTLLEKLQKSLPLMFRPNDILKALQVVNGAKRRGQSVPTQGSGHQTIVSLTLPTMITQQFVTNAVNQVVSAGDQDLVTMQSGNLLAMSEKAAIEAPQPPRTLGKQTDESNTSEAESSNFNL